MEKCIICDKMNSAISIEHIVSESFGNKRYTMKRGEICDDCNKRFSKFEGKTLSNTVFVMERARLGVKTKKGKNAKGRIKELTIEGDTKFESGKITISGLNENNFTGFNPSTQIGELIVLSFDKSEVATSRFLLKVGIEALFTSKRKVFNNYNFDNLKNYLTNKDNKEWGFITADKEHGKFNSIPSFSDKYALKKINCELRFQEKSSNQLLFKFRYGAVSMIINLINRNLDWVQEYKDKEDDVNIYPLHFNEKKQ